MDKVKAPKDGTEAFYQGFTLDNNPYPDWTEEFEEWDRDFLETAKNYNEEKQH